MPSPLVERLPGYPWDRLAPYQARAAAHPGGVVDLSIGTPVDPTPQVVRDALIAAELQRLGRSGVPAYVFYEGVNAPRLLSELPSVEEVRAAVSSNR